MKKYRIYIEERVERNHLIEFESDLSEDEIEEFLNKIEGDSTEGDFTDLDETLENLCEFKITKIRLDKGETMEISIPSLDEL